MPILKPESCSGCPFYGKSKYITPDYIVPNSTISIVAQNPGDHEEQGSLLEGHYYEHGKRLERTSAVTPQPLIGASGNWLQREFWPLTGIPYAGVSRQNVLKCRPYNSNELPNVAGNKVVNAITVKELKEAVAFCTRTHLRFPASTEFILAMGELSLYALTGEELLTYKLKGAEESESPDRQKQKKSTITEWRGWALGVDLIEHQLLGLSEYYTPMQGSTLFSRLVTVFPVVHIASLFHNNTFYHATLLDFERFGRLVRGTWPLSLPEIHVNTLPHVLPRTVGFDTEYTQDGTLTMWSLADVSGKTHVVDAAYSALLSGLPEHLTLITQHGIVDLPHFLPLVPEAYLSLIRMEDCMLAHAVLWPGEYHSLDYQLSKYGSFNRHKHLRETPDQELRYLYAGLDAYTTLNDAWKAHIRHFKRDRLLWREYALRRQPLIPIITRYLSYGLRIDTQRVALIAALLEEEALAIAQEVQALTGEADFNIRSPKQVGEVLYAEEGEELDED